MLLVKRGRFKGSFDARLAVNNERDRLETLACRFSRNPKQLVDAHLLPSREKRPRAETYAAFFSPDNAPRSFFIHAEKRWRFCSRRTTASLVTQLN